MTEKQIAAFGAMAALTKPLCGVGCPVKNCCEPRWCDIATPSTPLPRNKDNMYLDEKGNCLVLPHQRPLCTVHHCSIVVNRALPGPPENTQRYFALQAECQDAMVQTMTPELVEGAIEKLEFELSDIYIYLFTLQRDHLRTTRDPNNHGQFIRVGLIPIVLYRRMIKMLHGIFDLPQGPEAEAAAIEQSVLQQILDKIDEHVNQNPHVLAPKSSR